MQIFNQIPPKEILPHSIADKLWAELNPSNDIDEARGYWGQINCHLLILDEWDKPDCLECLSNNIKQQLHHSLEYPEYIDDLGQYRLLLGVTGDDGSGLFLLCCESIGLDQLKEVIYV